MLLCFLLYAAGDGLLVGSGAGGGGGAPGFHNNNLVIADL